MIRRQLDNGLTLLIERDTTAPVVAAVTHVKAGYFDEPDETMGIAHVLEHMFFKGTTRRGRGELAAETQRLGGYLNAGTIYDKTIYYTVLPSATGALEQAVDLQADALMHSTIDPGELGRELEVIIQEVNRKLDNPPAVANEKLYELLFAQHRMRRWRIGTEEGLRRLSADDVRSYYATRYVPERTIVALVGDLDVDEALRCAERTYGPWNATGGAVEPSPSETEPPGPALEVLHGDVERPLAVMGWRSVAALHEDASALDMAASVLGSGRGSWLSRAVRMPGLASGASGSHYTPTEVGVFTMGLNGEAATLEEAVLRSLALAERLGSEGPHPSDLARVRALSGMQWHRRLETMDGRATLWADFEALGGFQLADTLYDKAMAVTADDVCDVARRYIQPNGASCVIYLPNDETTNFAPSSWPPPVTESAPLAVVNVTLPNKSSVVEGQRGETTRDHEGNISHVVAAGADLLLRPKPGSGLVFVGAYFGGLREAETEGNSGISALVSRAALRGAGGLDGEQIALAAEGLGGAISPSVSLGAVGWGMTVPSAALADAANLIRLVASECTLSSEALSIERSLQASDAARARDDMFSYPVRRALREALPGSAYGLPTLGEPDGIAGLADETVRSWAARIPTRRLIVVTVGDLTVDAMREGLRPFDGWPGTLEPGVGSAFSWSPSTGREQRQKAQSAMAMAFPCGVYGSPDRYPLIVLGSLLSGMAGRLFMKLRDERSLAYTVTTMPWFKRRAGAMLTYIANSPEREEEARDAMLDELQRVGDEDIGEAELDRARNYAAGALQLRLQSAHAVASEIINEWVHGDLNRLHRTADWLREVTAVDVQRVAAAVFDPSLRSEFVVEGTATVKTST